jgi:hypothetical protein
LKVTENLKELVNKIPSNVTLIAVSKYQPLEPMREAYEFGIRNFGESKVQELIFKFDNFYKDVNWHFIGHLQTNKVKYIVGKVNLIHSLDSIKLLKEIEKSYSKNNLVANVLMQVNIGREENKYGILEEDLDKLIDEVEKCSFVKVKGIMAILPKGDEASNRMYFSKVHHIWSKLKEKNFKNITMEILSMGMTNDYSIAIEEGSNMVRIGEGIFGHRNYNK